ncbi:unnamed protein product [Bursaphelenchus xylophilus]|uniref:(pine wood nematode) hypothetical protein n=1 Tax=Bursaphelenchus xylophilus TaxID=6326 RepID=A0A1I7SAQ6_BURXY|nr:unnamed protein product [Bursaphelenchus xylophilus]CAG9126884.1 unnamed protein product [Bursaphelenchus xylophilus]
MRLATFRMDYIKQLGGGTRTPELCAASSVYWSSILKICAKFLCFTVVLYALFYFTTFDAELVHDGHFKRPPGTEHVDCKLAMDRSSDYADIMSGLRNAFLDPPDFQDLPVDCASIHARNTFTSKPTSKAEKNFPLAIVRNVFKDYYYQELMLAAIYQPQNFYCYSIDIKADPVFKKRMNSLAKCFKNVVISNISRDMDSLGHGTDMGHLDCMEWLVQGKKDWKYVQVLQNHDFPHKTNGEAVQILQILNGANDISVTKLFTHRINVSDDWTFDGLNLIKNTSHLAKKFANTNMTLSFVKGHNHMTLTKAAVQFIFENFNLSTLVQKIDRPEVFGVDEIILPTLLSMPELEVPGHFTQKCAANQTMNQFVTRFANWRIKELCRSRQFRHHVCIFGIEDLAHILKPAPHLVVNKLMPDFDFNAVVCQLEALYNRTFLGQEIKPPLNMRHYQALPHVIFQNLKDSNGKVSQSDMDKYRCY